MIPHHCAYQERAAEARACAERLSSLADYWSRYALGETVGQMRRAASLLRQAASQAHPPCDKCRALPKETA